MVIAITAAIWTKIYNKDDKIGIQIVTTPQKADAQLKMRSSLVNDHDNIWYCFN